MGVEVNGKISWRDMETNEEILQAAQKKQKSYGFDLEKKEVLDRSYTPR